MNKSEPYSAILKMIKNLDPNILKYVDWDEFYKQKREIQNQK